MSTTLRAVIVDDQKLIGAMLARGLEGEPGILVLAVYHDVASAVDHAAEHPADVVLLDAKLHEEGFDARDVTTIRDAYAPAKVVIVSSYTERHIVRQALAAGASGYASKADTPADLLAVVWRALDGDVAVSPDVEHWRSTDSQSLNKRDEMVIDCVMKGMSNAQMAAHMILSESTVEKRVAAVCRKLGVDGRRGIVAWAVKRK